MSEQKYFIRDRRISYCPHCGPGMSITEAVLVDMTKRWQVYCGACGSSSGSTKTADEAIELWNKRYDGTTGRIDYL